MATTKSVLIPLQPEDREALLQAVRDASEPLTVLNVVKLAQTSRKAKTDEVAAILDEFVADGRLNRLPPKTAKGKPRYWDRDPKTVGRAAILELVRQAPEPVSASDVKKQLKLPFKLSPVEITAILEECAQEGRIHPIPAKTAKSGPRYWNRDALEFARRCVLQLLEKKGPQADSAVRRAVKWLEPDQSQQLIKGLTDSRLLYVHPPVGTSKKIVYGSHPPSPEPYLKKISSQLSDVVERLKAADVPVVELRRALVQMVESAGVPFGAVAGDHGDGKPQQAAAGDLIALMKQIEPGAERGALVTARDLRRVASLDKAGFDSLALELARNGKLVLHRHDFASSLSPVERDELITDGRGTYYVGLALRPQWGAS